MSFNTFHLNLKHILIELASISRMATLYGDVFYMFHVFINEVACVIAFHSIKTNFYLE